MIKLINKMVTKLLTNRILNVIFFLVLILLFLFILVVIPIMLCNTDLSFKDILAPMIISFSAILASSVAMINLRTGYIKDMLKENKNDISEIRILSILLKTTTRKIKIYKEVTISKRKTNYHLLNDLKKTFSNIKNILKDKIFIYHISDYKKSNPFELLDIMEENLSLSIIKLDELLEWKEQNNKNKFDYLPKGILNTIHIDNLHNNCEDLCKIISQIDQKIINSYKKLKKEEKC